MLCVCWRPQLLIALCNCVFLLQTREGRPQRSKIVKNSANPQYNEEFFLLVDDLEHQKLSIKVSPCSLI